MVRQMVDIMLNAPYLRNFSKEDETFVNFFHQNEYNNQVRITLRKSPAESL